MCRPQEQLNQWPPAGTPSTSAVDITLVHAKMAAASFLQRLDHAGFAGMSPQEMEALRKASTASDQVHYKTGLAFDRNGEYKTHRINLYHYQGLDNKQLHQKLAALLTIGEIIVSGVIPCGIEGVTTAIAAAGAAAAAAGGDQPADHNKKLAVANYPFFRFDKNNRLIVEQKFRLDLKAKETITDGPDEGALLEVVCEDLYNKATISGGEYDTMQKCFDQTKRIWKSFFPPAKKAAKGASQAASADSDHS